MYSTILGLINYHSTDNCFDQNPVINELIIAILYEFIYLHRQEKLWLNILR